MNEDSHKSLINNKNSTDISQNEVVVTRENSRRISEDELPSPRSTYESFFWFCIYTRNFATRLANDIIMSFLRYWFPNQVPLPYHLADLIGVHDHLRAERELNTVTYSSSREQRSFFSSGILVRELFDAFKSYVLSSEDDVSFRQIPNNIVYNGPDCEPMFVIVDSACVSNTSTKEDLTKSKSTKDTVLKKELHKYNSSYGVPSTSNEFKNEVIPPQIVQTETTDETQILDVNLQNENEITYVDSDLDKESVVITYLRSLRSKDTLPVAEDFSESSLDVLIPSFPGTPRSIAHLSLASMEDIDVDFKQVIDFLHRDNEFLIAAEIGDDVTLEKLIAAKAETSAIHEKDHLGRNALHLAVCTGNRRTVRMLLNAGVNPNVKDNVGMTPLSLCLMRSPSWRMANMLFDYGAEILPRTNPMDTGLFLQFVMMSEPTREEERILRLLVEKGCLINDPEAPGGRQALHFAAMSDNCHLIKVLLDLGADIFLTNHRNQTPREVAATYKCRDAYMVLEECEDFYNADKRTLTVTHL